MLENVAFHLDRSTYFASEQMLVLAKIWTNGLEKSHASDVLYLEIIDANGKSVIKKKLAVSHMQSRAAIELPAELVTGNYLVRAYTKMQLSAGANQLATKIIRIVNPDLPAIETVKIPNLLPVISATNDPKTINPNQIASITSAMNCAAFSIVKSGLAESQLLNAKFDFHENKTDKKTIESLPEIRNTDIRGRVKTKEKFSTDLPLLVFAATLGAERQFHVTEADSHGYFMIALPQEEGLKKVYITTNIESEIEIFNDFSSELPQVIWGKDTLLLSLPPLLQIAYQDAQIASRFSEEIQRKISDSSRLPEPFTNPTQTILLADYVEMNTLKEAFEEIVPYVYVRKDDGKSILKMYDFKTKFSIDDPLVMIDNLPFNDHEQVLDIAVNKVHSIDVFAEPLVIGNQYFKGIINIKTEQGLLGGLELPKNCVSIDYSLKSDWEYFEFPADNDGFNFNNTVFFGFKNAANFHWPKNLPPRDYQLLVYLNDGRVEIFNIQTQ